MLNPTRTLATIPAKAARHPTAGDVVVLAAGAGTVALRRIRPEVAVTIAIAALGATQSVSTSRTTPVALALLLDFYMVGRRCETRRSMVVAAGLLVAPLVVLIAGPQGKSVFDVATSWSFACALPFAAGRAIAYQDRVNGSLRMWADHLAQHRTKQGNDVVELSRHAGAYETCGLANRHRDGRLAE
jgi:hypothetical protein